MSHLLNYPGDIKADPVDASKATVIKPTEKEIPLPEIKHNQICNSYNVCKFTLASASSYFPNSL